MTEEKNIQTPPVKTPLTDKEIFKKGLIKSGIISALILLALFFSNNPDKQVVILSFIYGLFCFAANSFVSLRRIVTGLNTASSPGFFVSNSFFRMGLFGLLVAIAMKYLGLNLLMIFIGFFLPFMFIIYEKIRELYRGSKKIDKVLK